MNKDYTSKESSAPVATPVSTLSFNRTEEDQVHSDNSLDSGTLAESAGVNPTQTEKQSRVRKPPKAKPHSFKYNPSKLFDLCLNCIGNSPEECVTPESIAGRGDVITGLVLAKILEKGKLTVPLVQIFKKNAQEENHSQILAFISKLDILAAMPIYIPSPCYRV